ncbi:CHRD domain-containing protein [Cognatiluteimonas profundi]|uniref:CHRD domain-containing protein n=1 Tax=Cognatiluteimonas profundi TaxID=2594501 RepID=UPI00131DB5EC|nr:CHRD domain-containing protein [Lysobacter profundi]
MKMAGMIATLLLASAGSLQAADLRLHALLDGASVVSATDSLGTGEATATLSDDGKVRLTMVFGGLSSNVTGATLQLGSSAENGAAVAPLDVRMEQAAGSVVDAELTLTPLAAGSVRAGNSYLLVTTSNYPKGEIRGQLVPQPVRLETQGGAITP